MREQATRKRVSRGRCSVESVGTTTLLLPQRTAVERAKLAERGVSSDCEPLHCSASERHEAYTPLWRLRTPSMVTSVLSVAGSGVVVLEQPKTVRASMGARPSPFEPTSRCESSGPGRNRLPAPPPRDDLPETSAAVRGAAAAGGCPRVLCRRARRSASQRYRCASRAPPAYGRCRATPSRDGGCGAARGCIFSPHRPATGGPLKC